jgi:hypothetical protein
MKKFIVVLLSAIIGYGASAHDTTNIDQKLLQLFKTSFPNAQEVTWHEATDAYVANFVENGVRSKIAYTKDGSVAQLTRTYQEQGLPYSIGYKVKEEFPGKNIFGVVEVLTRSERENYSAVEYYIKLEDAKNWITVKVNGDGETTVIEKYKKAS